jgi:Protein of unknown function (DUF4238)
MPAEQPKAQHFVHRAYLEGFQDSSLLRQKKRAVWLYMPGKTPIRQAPERLAKRNYYYCHHQGETRQFFAEDVLQKLEDAALPILNQLRNRDFTLSLQDRLTFGGYVALSHTRVPTFETLVNYLAALTSARQLEHIANNRAALEWAVAEIEKVEGKKIDVDDHRKGLTGGSVYATQTNRAWSLKQMFEAMQSLQEVIYRMFWTFMIAPESDDGFLTSDNPVAFFDPVEGMNKHIGSAILAAPHFTFPICKDICLLAQPRRNPDTVRLNASDVRQVNRGTITRADGQLYAPFNSGPVQRLFNKIHKQTSRPRRVLLDHGRVVVE